MSFNKSNIPLKSEGTYIVMFQLTLIENNRPKVSIQKCPRLTWKKLSVERADGYLSVRNKKRLPISEFLSIKKKKKIRRE